MICTWYLAWIPLVIFQNCLKFHLRYLCQISLQIMLLPIQIWQIWLFLCGKKPIWNKMVTLFKCNSVEDAIARPNDCLLFAWANRSVHGLGRWISSRNRTHEFHLAKNRRERVKLVSKMGLKKWNTDFLLEYYDRENWTTLTFRTLCSFKGIFHRHDPTSRVP